MQNSHFHSPFRAISPDRSHRIQAFIQDALRLSAPAWPLQNAVAVNPFWFLTESVFDSAVRGVEKAVHSPLLLPLSRYRELLDQGEISTVALLESIHLSRVDHPSMPESVEAFLQAVADSKEPLPEENLSFAEVFQPQYGWDLVFVNEVGKYAAAYLDDSQALAPFPWRGQNFWDAWIAAQDLDQSMEIHGIHGFGALVGSLRHLKSEEAIAQMVLSLELESDAEVSEYLKRLVATVLGWMSQFKYLDWQKSLGHAVSRQTLSSELLAVRLAYDFALFQLARRTDPSAVESWKSSWERRSRKAAGAEADFCFRARTIFQLAWEKTYQKQVSSQINKNDRAERECSNPRAQMVFCIDVRSEMIRRHIEESSRSDVQTLGFAGFFGMPFSYRTPLEKQSSSRLPVLLKPGLLLRDPSGLSRQASRSLESELARSYFRNLRKNAISSFAYVELFGMLYLKKMFHRTWLAAFDYLNRRPLPSRFMTSSDLVRLNHLSHSDGTALTVREQVTRAATVLRHMGMTSHFSPLVIIVGHGSDTTNNLFGAALDCGACGGHAGDLNALILAELLNSTAVREGLAQEGIVIPASTWFMAAVHETVTDEIFALDQTIAPPSHRDLVAQTFLILKEASQQTRAERQGGRSSVLDKKPQRRTKNWAEVRPEWGLAGNACFIVAPRRRTLGVNLSSRSFLHDYDWQKDQANSYETLELIMTAPMVVTHWINLQYYVSTLAPGIYGAGNKVIHNLVNEAGVFEGNGGDLRIGLPLQSVHDGERFVHDPLRLSVFIEAPREQLEHVIRKHLVVRNLVQNDWIHLLHIDPSSLNVERRLRDGRYASV